MKVLFSLFIFILSPVLLFCQYSLVTDESDFKKEVAVITANTETMMSDFVQEKHLSFMSQPITTKGKFLSKRPGKIRWEYTEPFSYILIINGDKLYIDDEGNKNKIDLGNNDMFKQINKIISNALVGKVLDESEEFSHTLEESSKDFRITLTPIDQGLEEYIRKIEVYFDKESLIVSKVELSEASDDSTLIIFKNKKLNESILDKEFELKE